jgi:hypothetical protein
LRAIVALMLSLNALPGFPTTAFAGPPYITDDPEPVEYRHWEIYFAAQFAKQSDAWNTTAPHLEVNYGPIPNVQLQVITPMILDAPSTGATNYGYGDTQFGIKYRFIQEGDSIPQVATYPLLNVPTGSHSRNLGAGHVQAYFPLWLQNSVGKWTAYGGSGYWINPGAHNRNWWYSGIVLQRQVLPDLTLGAEFFHQTSQQTGQSEQTAFNLGMEWSITNIHGIVFSIGPAFGGSGQMQGYLAYRLTFGPDP